MKIVLLFFCGILIFLITLILLVIFSKIRLNIKEINISNIAENGYKKKLEKEMQIYLEIYLLGIIKIAKIRVTKDKIKKLNIRTDTKAIKRDIRVIKNINPIKIIKKLKIKIKKAYLDLWIGIDDVTFTAYAVAIISTIVRTNIKRYRSKKGRI